MTSPGAEAAPEDGDRRGVERLEAFSDGVFAIAITLLVLGIEVPEVSDQELGAALGDLLPSVYAYFLGFVIIGIFWIDHHGFFADVERHDGRLLWSNLILLALIAAMPFTTSLIGEYSSTSEATIIFAANVALASLAASASQWEAMRSGLLHPRSALNDQPFINWSLVTPAVFALSIPIAALVSPAAGQYFWLAALLSLRGR